MLSDWRLRLRSLFKRRVVEQELDEELRFHFDRLVESHLERGFGRDEAMRRARLALGGFDQIKEEHRDARGIALVDGLGRDLAYAGRQIWRAPGFAMLAVLCLGLGIGVNVAIFSVINSVLLRPMPVDEPDRLVMITRGETGGLSYSTYRDFQSRTRTLAGLAASFPSESDVEVDGQSEFVVGELVSANYAEVLGVRSAVGRWFRDEREPAAVISHALRERWFQGEPDVLGRIIQSGSESYTIVGVAPREFQGVFAPMRTDIWVPIHTRTALASQLEERESRLRIMQFGRLRAGTTPAQASAELTAIDTQLMAAQGAAVEPPAPIVAGPVRGIPNPGSRGVFGRITALLAAVVGLVLLIACVNVGNLLLVRGALRQRELAVRRALGASRLRLVRQLLTETLILAAAGGVCGVVLAWWTTRLLERSFPATVGVFALQLNLSVDRRAIAFAFLISLATTILCGLVPAWRMSRAPSLVTFKSEIGAGGPRRRPIGLVAQVVMSLALLFVAGSFLQALLRLQATDPGFDAAGRLYAYTWLPSPSMTPQARREFYTRALDRLRALPGVRRVALTSSLPLMPSGSDCASGEDIPQISITSSAVESGYFETMGIDFVAGRDFIPTDPSTGSDAAVIVNESFARRMWPNSAAVDRRVTVGCTTPQASVVVGVVRDSAIRSVGETPHAHLYRRLAASDSGVAPVLVDASTDPASLVEPVRRALLGLGQGIRVYTVQPLSVHVDRSFEEIRWLTGVLTVFGLLALVLAAVGLYGIIAYRVTLRTQEIGVRMALGASRKDVFREVITYGFAVVLVGIVIGEVLTAGLTGLAARLQEGVRPSGPATHVIIALIWMAVAIVACYVPAARASRVDPLTALRHE